MWIASALLLAIGCAHVPVATAPAVAAAPPVAATPPVASTAAKTPEATPPQTAYPTMAPLEQYLMDRDAEIALAKSAAPPAIASDATVLVLTKSGYEKAVEGKNGFVCLVERGWTAPFTDPAFWSPKERAPNCMNAPAARSALPVNVKRTELVLAGLTKDAILAKMKALMAENAFPALEMGSMSYMLSKDGMTDAGKPHHAHLMFYVPGDMQPSVWGANLPEGSAVYGGAEPLPGGGYLPWTLFFVPVSKWSDGTSADAGPHAH